MGLAPALLHALNPTLVIVRISGWGQTGPYSHKPGFGTLVEAMSGFAHLNGFPDKPPALPPLAMADMIAGVYGAAGVLTALRVAEKSGQGQVIDLSLFEPIFSFVASEAGKTRLTGEATMRAGNQSAHAAPRNVYQCGDGGYVALSGSMQSMAMRIFDTIGRPELKTDPALCAQYRARRTSRRTGCHHRWLHRRPIDCGKPCAVRDRRRDGGPGVFDEGIA